MQPADMDAQPSSVSSIGRTRKFTVLVFAAKFGPVDQSGFVFISKALGIRSLVTKILSHILSFFFPGNTVKHRTKYCELGFDSF